MSRSRSPGCSRGRGCGVCGVPARVALREQLEEIEEREAEQESLEVGENYPYYCCEECGA